MTTQTQSAQILLRSGEARKVGQRSTGMIRYDIVSDSERTKVFVRITGNDGGGYFSRELIDFDNAIDNVTPYKNGSSFPSKVFASAFVGKSSKWSDEIDLKLCAVCTEQVANFIIDGFLRPGDEVSPVVFGLLPDDLDEIEFGTIWRQVEQLHAMLA